MSKHRPESIPAPVRRRVADLEDLVAPAREAKKRSGVHPAGRRLV